MQIWSFRVHRISIHPFKTRLIGLFLVFCATLNNSKNEIPSTFLLLRYGITANTRILTSRIPETLHLIHFATSLLEVKWVAEYVMNISRLKWYRLLQSVAIDCLWKACIHYCLLFFSFDILFSHIKRLPCLHPQHTFQKAKIHTRTSRMHPGP